MKRKVEKLNVYLDKVVLVNCKNQINYRGTLEEIGYDYLVLANPFVVDYANMATEFRKNTHEYQVSDSMIIFHDSIVSVYDPKLIEFSKI